MASTSLLYRSALLVARATLPLAGLASPKLRQGHRGRTTAPGRLTAWARAARSPGRPLVWFHAASVGEGLQAEAVLRRLRHRHPKGAWQVVFTHFSASASGLASRLEVDAADFLPYDLPASADALLDALQPSALVFTKHDLWPELATRAARRGVPVALIAATVRPGSGRLRWPARRLLAPGYAALSAVGAIAAEDADRLARLGAPRSRIEISGDPRFDSVSDRVREVPPSAPLLRYGAGAPTMVAGSTWPGDEAVLLDAFARLHVHRPQARLILVPHEPTPERLSEIERGARTLGLPAPVRLSAAGQPAPLLLVDRCGELAALYGAGTMAYVGGGFHDAGLHSVLEPAAWGVPVVFGPRWTECRDAALLLQAGGAEALPELGTSEAGESLERTWDAWIVDPARRAAQGARARGVVTAGLGAGERSANLVERLVPRED